MSRKLVRDRVGDVPWKIEEAKAGLRPIRSESERNILLREKLLEEVGEFLTAAGDDVIDEAADVIQVILAIASAWNVSEAMIENRRREKLKKRGGFVKGLVLEL